MTEPTEAEIQEAFNHLKRCTSCAKDDIDVIAAAYEREKELREKFEFSADHEHALSMNACLSDAPMPTALRLMQERAIKFEKSALSLEAESNRLNQALTVLEDLWIQVAKIVGHEEGRGPGVIELVELAKSQEIRWHQEFQKETEARSKTEAALKEAQAKLKEETSKNNLGPKTS